MLTWKRMTILLLPVVVLAAGLVPAGAGDAEALRAELQERRAAVEPGDTNALYRLGTWCREQGLAMEARKLYEEALASDPDHRLARKALGYEQVDRLWLRGDALKKARGFVRLGSRWVLREEVIAHEAREREKLMKDERAREQLERAAHLVRSLASPSDETRQRVRAELGTLPVETTFRPLVAALNSSGADAMRRGAVEILATYEPERVLRPLVRASITDPAASVRTAAVAAVKSFALPGALAPYATALGSTNGEVRQHAIQAIGELGQAQGIQILIRFWEQRGGASPRAHIFMGHQLAYIQDFDVEVAQTAFIADPIVGTLQEGSVLEAKVQGMDRFFTTVERNLVQKSLKQLAGVDAGPDVKAWVSWAAKNGRRSSGAPADLEPTGDLR